MLQQAPLHGIRVNDMTRYLAGPVAGRVLADLGAEVIKVEPPEGDPARQVLPKVGGVSVYFTQHNAGERCLCLDLRLERDRDRFLRLVEKSDVVLENFRPGVMDRRSEMMSLLEQFVARFETASELEAALEPHSLPVGKVRTLVAFAEGAWAAERDLVAEPVSGVRIPRSPWRWDGGPVGAGPAVGDIGADNEYVLGDIVGPKDLDAAGDVTAGVETPK